MVINHQNQKMKHLFSREEDITMRETQKEVIKTDNKEEEEGYIIKILKRLKMRREKVLEEEDIMIEEVIELVSEVELKEDVQEALDKIEKDNIVMIQRSTSSLEEEIEGVEVQEGLEVHLES